MEPDVVGEVRVTYFEDDSIAVTLELEEGGNLSTTVESAREAVQVVQEDLGTLEFEAQQD